MTASPTSAMLQKVLAGLAAVEARQEETTKAVASAQADAREARDTAREITVILREQNALERVAEVRAEARKLVADLRADVEHAMTLVRTEQKTQNSRLDAIELLKTKGQGVLLGGKWTLDLLKIVAGAGGGALLLKMLEAM
ncbi:hypothetical protein [Caulobacter sp. RHG1]|uniref:hypothetical protein n=1 Tax=Caulobacter sp. (strain RHG1) TaxID=2545762 RepID=UPI001556B691|nr:hypothetical protein [Caulobacter sp. RHG1]NQE62974.1 hypothetical protein [Caulobacter sp. RHG1]